MDGRLGELGQNNLFLLIASFVEPVELEELGKLRNLGDLGIEKRTFFFNSFPVGNYQILFFFPAFARMYGRVYMDVSAHLQAWPGGRGGGR